MQLLFTRNAIDKGLDWLAADISRDYQNRDLVVVGVLNGAFIFTSDLVRKLEHSTVQIEFIKATSYHGTRSSGSVHIEVPALLPIKGKHVLICEDVLDSGKTAELVTYRLAMYEPASIKWCALAVKNGHIADYAGFALSTQAFLIGYGMDYNGRYRNLPEIYTL